MIPMCDVLQLVKDLNTWGWRDYKIEVCCGLGSGYISQVRCGNIKNPSHDKVVRLFNFWEWEAATNGVSVPQYSNLQPEDVSRGTLQTRLTEVTTN